MSERPIIESVHNPRIKQAARLRDAKSRRKLNRFLIDGWREIELAVQFGVELETIFFSSDTTHPSLAVAGARRGFELQLQPVTAKVLERISYGQRQDTPVAVAVTPKFELQYVPWRPPQILLVLDRTEKPGNLGACLRTAAAAGVSAVVLTDPVCEPCNPNTIRASRGSLFSVPLAVTTCAEFQAYCRLHSIPCFTARVDASTDLWRQDFTAGAALVFGSEAQGLGVDWQGDALRSFSIPMQGAPDSLNLSNSAAISLYEAVRQNRCSQ